MLESRTPGLTVIGLGPCVWRRLSVEAVEELGRAEQVYVRSLSNAAHSMLREHLPHLSVRSLEEVAEKTLTAECAKPSPAESLVRLAQEVEGVTYAAMWSSAEDALLSTARTTASGLGLPITDVPGPGLVDLVMTALGLNAPSALELMDAGSVAALANASPLGEVDGSRERLHWRAPLGTAPLLIRNFSDAAAAESVQRWLQRFFPAHHAVQVVYLAPSIETKSVLLQALAKLEELNDFSVLYVPALNDPDNVRTFSGLMDLTRTLRAPEGCPWDREQTHASLKPHLLEEAYEVLEALDSGDPGLLAEELGDLLFQVTIHSQLAAEAGTFTIEDVLAGVTSKLIGRHPHVFGKVRLENSSEVLRAWETFKQREKPARGSVLEEIPRGLPSLPQSNLIQKRASAVGFEWPDLEQVLAKVDEELEELAHEVSSGASDKRKREEYGDILFALVSVARHLRIDPEEALRHANRKFTARFQYVEARIRARNKVLADISAAELDTMWEEAKAGETSSS